jgi:hypothetical protein
MPKNAQKTKQQCARAPITPYLVALIVFIAVAVVSYVIFNDLYSAATPGGFASFKSSFNAAQRVAIYVADYNSTVFSNTGTCADKLITSMITYTHRNSSTIDYFIVNGTSCTYVRGLGAKASNGTIASIGDCKSLSGSEPTIYLNYSSKNETIIKPDYLYTSGDGLFLSECGIATEIS